MDEETKKPKESLQHQLKVLKLSLESPSCSGTQMVQSTSSFPIVRQSKSLRIEIDSARQRKMWLHFECNNQSSTCMTIINTDCLVF